MDKRRGKCKIYLMVDSSNRINVAHAVGRDNYLSIRPENDRNIKYDKMIRYEDTVKEG